MSKQESPTIPSRRDLRPTRRNKPAITSFTGETNIFKIFARIILLGLLAAFTIGLPLSGILAPSSLAASGLVPGEGQSLLSLLSKSQSLEDSDNFEAVPAAVTRTRMRTAGEMGICTPVDQSANGDIASAELSAKFIWPMYKGTYEYVSPFGMRTNPVTGQYILHEGIDWAAPVGTPLLAVADGKVIKAGPFNGGYAIYIEHNVDGVKFISGYLHMYSHLIFVSEGEEVKAGQVIAGVGSSGRSTGPHLHFEIRLGKDNPVEPLGWMEKHGAVFKNPDCR